MTNMNPNKIDDIDLDDIDINALSDSVRKIVASREFYGLSDERIELHKKFQEDFPRARSVQTGDSYLWADGISWKAYQIGYKRGIAEQEAKVKQLMEAIREIEDIVARSQVGSVD